MKTTFSHFEQLSNIPAIDDLSYEVAYTQAQPDDVHANAFLLGRDGSGQANVIAFINGEQGCVYRCCGVKEGDEWTIDSIEDAPLVKTVGSFDGQTGQIVIKQPEGHWRRYSRWDRIKKAPPTQPRAIVRTLPQCGCGGYLGAPMMFDSFKEMLSYFFVVFSDAQSVNAKHAAILNGGSCPV